MPVPAADDDPVAAFARSYGADFAAELGEQAALPTREELVRLCDARTLAWAAVGAVNRRDYARALIAAQHLLRDREDTVVAIEVLTGILLTGVPQAALTPSCRIPVEFALVPGDDHCPTAVQMASDLLTGVAMADCALVAPVLHALADGHGLDILIVLVRAAAARIESFVGLDGDTVDAYYRISRGVG